MIAKFRTKQFLLFLLAGCFAAVVNILSRIFYNKFVSYDLSIVFAFITGMLTAFVLFKTHVFYGSANSTKKELIYFTIINIFALLQTYVISVVLANYIFIYFNFQFYPYAIAHLVGVAFPIFSSYLGHKYLSFRQ
jgi:putative flippase GtrA